MSDPILRARLIALRRSLINRLKHEILEPGLLAALANVQTALTAIDAEIVSTQPKERIRAE